MDYCRVGRAIASVAWIKCRGRPTHHLVTYSLSTLTDFLVLVPTRKPRNADGDAPTSPITNHHHQNKFTSK
ncbi:hypothetical protein THIOM_001626 [Candidatus Thiomargarita nelsonii]|uniref:Uncharacterized protein n=1 Tax=Candidatus Thiomargarita nelsonii TaxID=1003181 RepID=A0A176S3Q0_9GAMM|nr:hypothetical protein THIOM_001626 [Candidatus Thiomargarita nelsonii]